MWSLTMCIVSFYPYSNLERDDTLITPILQTITLRFCCSVSQLCLTLCNPMDCSRSGFPVLHYLLGLAQTQVHWVSDANHLILCHRRFLLSSNFPSIRVFSNESILHISWPKYWSFSIHLSNEYSGLISFRIGWFDCLAVQGTLKILLQHHNLKASVLQLLIFFMVQPSHAYMATGKILVFTTWTFVGKVMSLLFNMLSRFVISFLPRSTP